MRRSTHKLLVANDQSNQYTNAMFKVPLQCDFKCQGKSFTDEPHFLYYNYMHFTIPKKRNLCNESLVDAKSHWKRL